MIIALNQIEDQRWASKVGLFHFYLLELE
jgi:hypothetical protein